MTAKPATPLTQLPRKLAEAFPDRTVPGYYRCYMAALDGRFPTEKRGRQYFIMNEDLPAVAEAFGLADRVAA